MYRFLPILLILPLHLSAQVNALHDHDVPQALRWKEEHVVLEAYEMSFAGDNEFFSFLARKFFLNNPDSLYREFRQIDETTIYFLECRQPFSISSLVP